MQGTKAFSQTNTVIEGNQKDSSRSRGGQDDILNFPQVLKWVDIPPFILIASPMTGREKSKAFPGRLSEHPHSLVGVAGERGGTQASSPCCRLRLARLGLQDESKAEGAELDQCTVCGGLTGPVTGLPGPCGFPWAPRVRSALTGLCPQCHTHRQLCLTRSQERTGPLS